MKFFYCWFLFFNFYLCLNNNFYSQSNKEIKQPNFLFVLVDDQPFDAIGFVKRYPFLKTPNIDRLYEEGVNFENFFVTQSICSPSRASFLTGTYPHIHGANQNNKYVDPNWEKFAPYSVHLQEAGYQTAHVGKIHMAHFKGKDHRGKPFSVSGTTTASAMPAFLAVTLAGNN